MHANNADLHTPMIGSRLCLAAVLFATGTTLHAHSFCVTNAAMLQDALTQASDNGAYNGEENFINIVQGTYFTGAATNNKPFSYQSTMPGGHALRVTGGYTSGCFALQFAAPQTVLDGNSTTGVLSLQNLHGDISVSNLTIQNGHSSQPGGGLQINYLNNLSGGVNVSDTIIRSNHSTVSGGGLYMHGIDYVQLGANLIVDNHSDKQHGAGEVTGHGVPNSGQLWNNTVTQNTSGAPINPVGGLYYFSSLPSRVFNNIFWNNTGVGLYLDCDCALDHNDIGALGGMAPGSEQDDLSVVPRFVNAGSNNFHLARNSPLLGYGVPIFAPPDLDGYSYPVSGRADLGAYAETIFIDGLELP